MQATALKTDRTGTSDGRYTLRRELARGGMGRIWIADDGRLSRRVAVKELLEPSVARTLRFERELSLTSRLEHPSIVSIHDGGTWPDGKPFYVMRLVAGESLDHVIARAQDVADRVALLPHGIAVVDALAYAHAQGIVHRDLKPENVLVGGFGETVVIDWGLAKDLHAATPELVDGPYRELAHGATIGGEVLGTPAYMPPEQAMGDAVDARADVYSLGAVLYHLLGGVAPHRGNSVDEVLANVITGPPPSLAAVAPGVPADLVAIVEKAMARAPEDRYPTAGELAVDLKRFQGGQLVGAHRYTGRQLLARWLRKHRVAVIVAALALVALVALGGTSFAKIVREERAAAAARATAERNQAKAESLMSFMLVDLRGKLEPVGKLDLLESVALEARGYFHEQSLARTPTEQHQRAVAHHGLGQVLAARGKVGAALAEHRAALVIHQQLAAFDGKWLVDLAASEGMVGDALRSNGMGDAALAAYRRSIAIDEELIAAGVPRATGQLALAYMNLADVYFDERRDPAAALRERTRAQPLLERLVAEMPTDHGVRRKLVDNQAGIADMLMHTGDITAAEDALRKAAAAAEELAKADPTDAMFQMLLGDRLTELGGVLHNQQRFADALGYYRQALAVRERLSARDASNAVWRGSVAMAQMNIGEALAELGDLPGALAHKRTALAIIEEFLRVDATSVRVRGNHAFLQQQIGYLLLQQSHLAEGIAALESSRETLEQLVRDEPNNERWQQDLSHTLADLADGLAERRDFAASLALRDEVIATAERLAAKDASSVTLQVDVIMAVERLGETLDRAGRSHEARTAFERAIALAAKLPADNPTWVAMNQDLRAQLAKCCKGKHGRVH